MDAKLKNDISYFFQTYRSRTSDLLDQLPAQVREELEEELDLLRISILNRIAEG